MFICLSVCYLHQNFSSNQQLQKPHQFRATVRTTIFLTSKGEKCKNKVLLQSNCVDINMHDRNICSQFAHYLHECMHHFVLPFVNPSEILQLLSLSLCVSQLLSLQYFVQFYCQIFLLVERFLCQPLTQKDHSLHFNISWGFLFLLKKTTM